MASEHHELAQSGILVGRPESPALEAAAAEAIEAAFRELIEKQYLYQKVALDFRGIDEAVRQSVKQAAMRASTPMITGEPQAASPQAATVDRLNELHHEIEVRPWRLSTRHVGDNATVGQIHRLAQAGVQPLNTPVHELNLKFYLPAVQLYCTGACKGLSVFEALMASSDWSFGTPFPRLVNGMLEQVFMPMYRCTRCRDIFYTVLVRRVGGRLHLCGFAPRRHAAPVAGVPEFLLAIFSDAEQAVAEGDTYAGFYHLRTMIEHYLKQRLGVRLKEQVRGDDLVRRHYEKLSPELRGTLPSLTVAWEKLSVWLHTRTGEASDYQEQREAVLKHIHALELLTA